MGKKQRLRKQHKEARQAGTDMWEWAQEVAETAPIQVINTPPEVEKMSDVLKAFAAPWLQQAMDKEEIEEIMLAAVAAWNLSLLPKAAREKNLQILGEDEAAHEERLFLRELIARKQAYFAEIRRPIVEFRLVEKGPNELSFQVLSSASPDLAMPAEWDRR